MKRIVLVCGLIAGLISSAWGIVSVAKCYGKTAEMDFENGMVYGYTFMILAFSLIFVGTKNYRDKYSNGVISFGKAFRIGLYITLIASTMYVMVWLIDYYFFVPDFMEKYTAYMLEKLKAGGASQLEINKQAEEMAHFNVMLKNPAFNALVVYAEIVPVGLIVSLISALVLKRRSNPQVRPAIQ